nr:MAG TPA: hypothetical protein [Caudoviricetes sp.]
MSTLPSIIKKRKEKATNSFYMSLTYIRMRLFYKL